MGKKIHEFDDFFDYALDKDYDLYDIMDFQEHYQNLLSHEENLKVLDEFIKEHK